MIWLPFPAIVSLIFTRASTIVSVFIKTLFYTFPFYHLAIISISESSTAIQAFMKILIGRKLKLLMVVGTKFIKWSLGMSSCYFISLTWSTLWWCRIFPRVSLTLTVKIAHVGPMPWCIYLRKMVIQEVNFSWQTSIITIVSILTATPPISRTILPTNSCSTYLSVSSWMMDITKGRASLAPRLETNHLTGQD